MARRDERFAARPVKMRQKEVHATRRTVPFAFSLIQFARLAKEIRRRKRGGEERRRKRRRKRSNNAAIFLLATSVKNRARTVNGRCIKR